MKTKQQKGKNSQITYLHRQFQESMFRIKNPDALNHFLFEYACEIAEREKVNISKKENQGFIEHVVTDKLSQIVDAAIGISSIFEELGINNTVIVEIPTGKRNASYAAELFYQKTKKAQPYYNSFLACRR